MLESLDETLWELFKKTGKPNYYMMYSSLRSEEEGRDER